MLGYETDRFAVMSHSSLGEIKLVFYSFYFVTECKTWAEIRDVYQVRGALFSCRCELEFPHWWWLKKNRAHPSDSEEEDNVQGSDKQNLQHAGDGVPTLTWDNTSAAHLQWGYHSFSEIVMCDMRHVFQQLSESCLG